MNKHAVVGVEKGLAVLGAALVMSGCTTLAGSSTPSSAVQAPAFDGYVLCTGGTASRIPSRQGVEHVCPRTLRHAGML